MPKCFVGRGSEPDDDGADAAAPRRAADAAGRRADAVGRRRGPEPPSSAGQGPVVISGVNGESLQIESGPALEEAAIEWSRIVRNRARWSLDRKTRDAQAARSREMLHKQLGVSLRALRRVCEPGIIQVSIPYVREKDGWEERIFPWEYVLSSAIRNYLAMPIVIIRHLDRGGRHARPAADAANGPALVVESAPGAIRSQFLFDSERRIVRVVLGGRVQVLPDPTATQLRDEVAKQKPAIIHLAGVDSHQGARLLDDDDPGKDGYYLANDRGQPVPVESETVAEMLAAASVQPQLVACNFASSAARTAALAVAKGAAAAIGFQDGVDDALAEAFYARFYSTWQTKKWHTVLAFVRTLDELRSRPGLLTGLGIVLWVDQDVMPIVKEDRIDRDRAVYTAPSAVVAPPPPAGPRVAAGGVVSVTKASPDVAPEPEAAVTTVTGIAAETTPGDQAAVEPDSEPGSSPGLRLVPGKAIQLSEPTPLEAVVRVFDLISLVRLHNRKPLFKTFRVRKSDEGSVPDVQTEVTLDLGRHSVPYKSTKVLSQPVTELRDEIHVPLTSELLRSVHETIQSVVYVRVRRGNAIVYEDTTPVGIASADEWTDTDTETCWLPSFVLPSDPAIDTIRRNALPALRTFADRANEGFYGYQVLEAGGGAGTRRVDDQVNAIWSTLAFQYDLSYLNPPPGYSERSQRLRTPSEVVAGRAGTCIDLALLFAACLEAIDIYPVILMYEGHANVGYWRSPAAHADFVTMAEPIVTRREVGHDVQVDAWEVQADPCGVFKPDVLDPSRLRRVADQNTEEILRRVDRQDLAVLETTLLCERAGFADAIRGAGDTFELRRFRSLLDIRLARMANVTPLPIRFG